MNMPKHHNRMYKGYVINYWPNAKKQNRWSASEIRRLLGIRYLKLRFTARTLGEIKGKIREGETKGESQ